MNDEDLFTDIDQIDSYKEGMLEITCQFSNVERVSSVLKLMIQHDFNVVTEDDVFKIMNSKSTNLSR